MMHYSRSKGFLKNGRYTNIRHVYLPMLRKSSFENDQGKVVKNPVKVPYMSVVKSCQFLVTSAKYAICIFIHT